MQSSMRVAKSDRAATKWWQRSSLAMILAGSLAMTASCRNVGSNDSGCSNSCEAEGQTSCSDGKLQTCQLGDDGCLTWSTVQDCVDGFCADARNCGESCSPNPCHHGGTCTALGSGEHSCTCEELWDPAVDCEFCLDGFYEFPEGSGHCVDDPCLPDPCTGNALPGTCVADNGFAECSCAEGYSGYMCLCGDGTCDAVETCVSCAPDCGVCPAGCGDGLCEQGEDCSADCGTINSDGCTLWSVQWSPLGYFTIDEYGTKTVYEGDTVAIVFRATECDGRIINSVIGTVDPTFGPSIDPQNAVLTTFYSTLFCSNWVAERSTDNVPYFLSVYNPHPGVNKYQATTNFNDGLAWLGSSGYLEQGLVFWPAIGDWFSGFDPPLLKVIESPYDEPTWCNNGQQDGGETGVDCGGPYCDPC